MLKIFKTSFKDKIMTEFQNSTYKMF